MKFTDEAASANEPLGDLWTSDPSGGASSVDVVVVGGGPAGSIAALGLARLGLQVLICEHAPPMRSKCCGQCLNPRVAGLLERFGLLEEIDALSIGRTDRFEWRFEWRFERHAAKKDRSALESAPALRPRTVALDGSRPGWVVRREAFDDRLWQAAVAAGAVPLRGVAAQVGSRHGGFREVRLDDGRGQRHRIEARLVVGADGLGSGVARSTLGADRTRAGRKFGFSAALRSPPEAISRTVGSGCIHMRSVGGGYLGLVRERDGTIHLAGLVGPEVATRRPEKFVAEVLGLSETPILDRLTACGPLPWHPRRIAGLGVALVGDAAGYVEPFTGEGMAWAIEGAALLVSSIERRGLGDAGLAEYVERHRRAIATRQRTCRRLAALLDRPALVASAWRFADRLPLADAAAHSLGRRVASGLVRA
ncbi:MAG: NAD(P)/FAD-dependent oxidoreductase [Phycisphaerales bacterium]|jgi:flavin-dependent dehydrogenase